MARPSMTGNRSELLTRLSEAGRDLSDAVVMFHSAASARLGLGPSDWKILGLLERHGPRTAGELSEHAGLAPASVTGILDRLEDRGWIRRSRDEADRRRVVVALDHRLSADMGSLFGGLMRRLNELYARYPDRDLERLAVLLSEIAECQKEATRELEEA
jgi:predicted transcriptional regulator